jgi:hypothetical protein
MQTRALAERYKPLAEANAVSQQELVAAQAAFKQSEADLAAARAAVQTAQINLGYASRRVAHQRPHRPRAGDRRRAGGAGRGHAAGAGAAASTRCTSTSRSRRRGAAPALGHRRRPGCRAPARPATAVRVLLEDGSTYALPGRLLFSDLSVDAHRPDHAARRGAQPQGRCCRAVRAGAAGTGTGRRPSCCRSRRCSRRPRATRCWWWGRRQDRAAAGEAGCRARRPSGWCWKA